jgi:hypothetical protein
MSDHPAALNLGQQDVMGAWIFSIALATAFFGYPAVIAALDLFRAGV